MHPTIVRSVGDCAVYLSYDVAKPRPEQNWFKIANLYDCKSKNKQDVNIDIPPWLKAGPAVLRWYYSRHFLCLAIAKYK